MRGITVDEYMRQLRSANEECGEEDLDDEFAAGEAESKRQKTE
jgi:hypothetical protein